MDADGLPIVGRGINLAEVTLIFDLRVDIQTVLSVLYSNDLWSVIRWSDTTIHDVPDNARSYHECALIFFNSEEAKNLSRLKYITRLLQPQ